MKDYTDLTPEEKFTAILATIISPLSIAMVLKHGEIEGLDIEEVEKILTSLNGKILSTEVQGEKRYFIPEELRDQVLTQLDVDKSSVNRQLVDFMRKGLGRLR